MILVTGASGFIGKKLITALVNVYGVDHILALTSKPISECQYLLHDNYSFDHDYVIKAGYADVTTLLHAGAFTPKNSAEGNDVVSCTSNINNTIKLLQLELPALEKFVFLSTLDVYGKDAKISEDSPIDPVSLYGHSKLYCEKVIASWAKTNNKIAHLLRVGHIYGPGEEAYQKLIPATMRKLLEGQPLQLWGSGNELRSFLYIDDLVNSILKSLETKADLGVINLVSGKTISVRELIHTLMGISGIDSTVEEVKMTTEGRDLIFDNTKMQKELGLKETSLLQGLTAEWEYMKQFSR